jgi:hypothetical protein
MLRVRAVRCRTMAILDDMCGSRNLRERSRSGLQGTRQLRWRRFVLPWLVFCWPYAVSADELVRPEARAGWEVRIGDRLQLIQLPLEGAPRLPSWPPHGSPAGRAAAPVPWDGGNFEEVLLEALQEGLDQLNRHLPAPASGRFTFWIFDRVPYAAKTLDAQTVILSGRIFSDLQYREQLPCVFAHELHHLELARAGFYRNTQSVEETILLGLMAEGIATWMCISSGRFPEVAERLSNAQALVSSFERVRAAMTAAPDARSAADRAFREHKFGYDAGAWMVGRIEQRFGREAWLDLLRGPAADAPRRFLALYLATDPPAEYGF